MEGSECLYFECTLTEAKQDISLTAKLPLSNLKQIHVNLVNTPVFNAIPVVAASSVGGILLLLLIILILYKCGFFKRNYKDMIETEEETEH
ncbi:hypothetical protein scyTo_0021009 [Scyliorhinus torazame]|uniref:Integrin alpha-2 domain-containing protein n=1 Tax=Scyliorhinus torazame TaxID=75743 RepID=A0A401PTL7_SCYTO|nr:hypothetical protein [Scyliorhinus torazame]